MPTAAIIPASGIGVRFGEAKQFKLLGNKPLLIHTLSPFLQSKEIKEIVIVVSSDKLSITKKTISSLPKKTNIKLVSGGPHRQDSVYEGLKAVSDLCGLVCIHDGVRPFLSTELIESTIKACEKFDGAVAAEITCSLANALAPPPVVLHTFSTFSELSYHTCPFKELDGDEVFEKLSVK